MVVNIFEYVTSLVSEQSSLAPRANLVGLILNQRVFGTFQAHCALLNVKKEIEFNWPSVQGEKDLIVLVEYMDDVLKTLGVFPKEDF